MDVEDALVAARLLERLVGAEGGWFSLHALGPGGEGLTVDAMIPVSAEEAALCERLLEEALGR